MKTFSRLNEQKLRDFLADCPVKCQFTKITFRLHTQRVPNDSCTTDTAKINAQIQPRYYRHKYHWNLR